MRRPACSTCGGSRERPPESTSRRALAIAPAVPESKVAHYPAPAANAQRWILLVEENQDNAAAIADLLQAHGYRVDVADSIAAALRIADRGFDILVSDIGLPDGTGRELARRLAGKRPVPPIALTGYGTDEDIRRTRRASRVI